MSTSNRNAIYKTPLGGWILVLIASLIVFSCGVAAQDRVNIALGRPYTWSAEPNYALALRPSNETHLTDGQFTNGHWAVEGDIGAIVWNATEPVVITVDLGESQQFAEINARTTEYTPAGIEPVTKVIFRAGDTLENMTVIGELTSRDVMKARGIEQVEAWNIYNFCLKAISVRARYVSLEFEYAPFLVLDQIQIYQ